MLMNEDLPGRGCRCQEAEVPGLAQGVCGDSPADQEQVFRKGSLHPIMAAGLEAAQDP